MNMLMETEIKIHTQQSVCINVGLAGRDTFAVLLHPISLRLSKFTTLVQRDAFRVLTVSSGRCWT